MPAVFVCRPAAAAEPKPVKEKAAKGDKGKKPEGGKGPGKGAKQAQSAASPEEIRAVRLQKVGGRWEMSKQGVAGGVWQLPVARRTPGSHTPHVPLIAHMCGFCVHPQHPAECRCLT